MKKLLLLISSVVLGASSMMAQDTPSAVFPASFDVKTSCEGLTVEQGDDFGVYTIIVNGVCPDETFSITVEVPEGWDGFLSTSDSDFDPDINPLKRLGEYTPGEAYWVDIDEFIEFSALSGMTFHKSNTITFPADGQDHDGQLYLYKDGMVEAGNAVWVETHVEKGEPVTEPVFPADFKVTADSEEVTINQGFDEETNAWTIMVTGKTTKDEITLTFEKPEGWDGFIGGIFNFAFSNSRGDIEWVSVEEFEETMGGIPVSKSTSMSYPADGEYYIGIYHLYVGDLVNVSDGIMTAVCVEKSELSGIESVEVKDNAVRYFNLQGVEVENPKAGIFVKVADGKATKVAID